ncbi:MAG TPA: OB-fold domain-containing protein [Acidimicrobiales bacterium]
MTTGIVSWGVYLPYWRLQRGAIAASLGGPAGRGTRSVASYDEDTTTMGVEATRRAVASLGGPVPEDLFFSTTAPAYLDKTNAAAIHGAVELPVWAGAYDMLGSVRSAVGALRSARAVAGDHRSVAVLSDLRTGLAGGAEERDSGDGAAALVFGGSGDAIVAEWVAHAGTTEEFLDRWRTPGESDSKVWEERFGQEVYVPLVQQAWAEALKSAGVVATDVDHVAVVGLHARSVGAVRGTLGVRPEAVRADRSTTVGNLGSAEPGVALADLLEVAPSGALIALVVVADGADVVLLRTTEALPVAREARHRAGLEDVAGLAASGRDDLPYARFLTWRGELRREPPRRPDPERPGAPATWRSAAWKGGFEATDCRSCGFRHLPPARVCLRCRTIDEMDRVRLADIGGTVATFTVDRLAFSMSPPVVGAVVDFDGGGRYRCEMTDVDPDAVAVGTRVEMTFRRLNTAKGVHNYFWKARPVGGRRDADDHEGEGR